MVDGQLKKTMLQFQQKELEGAIIYRYLAKKEKNKSNKKTLLRIAQEEQEHYHIWKQYTKRDIRPNRLLVTWYQLLSVVMGFTFVLKLFEQKEVIGVKTLKTIAEQAPEILKILQQEEEQEKALIAMLDEERLNYVGAMVLGLNDALVELTGTIAGLTFALASTRLVALSGIITGISATLSMAASNYLAERAENNPNALKSSLYTGIAYLVTVVLMVLPYLLFPQELYLAAFGVMLAVVLLIIVFFNYYISVAMSQPFFKRFWEMALISFGVAFISFVIGLIAKQVLGIEV